MLETPSEELSEREREVLRLVATGAGNKEIAQRLAISPNTVKVHLRNIFAKIGTTSRTEATLYAIRAGIVQVDVPAPEPVAREAEAAPAPAPPARPASLRERWPLLAAVGGLIAVLALGVGLSWPRLFPAPATATLANPPSPTPEPRWQTRAPLPTARSGLAVAAYANQVYAIGGQAAGGVTGELTRYDPAADAWTELNPKPVPVADISAAVVGGLIYVPGGRLASGEITSTLEVYDPALDGWSERAALPRPLSGYALAAFEGQLYLFGGWDGQRALADAYRYDPSRDLWTRLTPMPTARAFLGAAVAGGNILVIGGTDGQAALSANEMYRPEREAAGQNPWERRAPLPEGRARLGIAVVADLVHVVGGEGQAGSLPPVEYFPQTDEWHAFEAPASGGWSGLGLAAFETNLLAVGGLEAGQPTTRTLAYKAIYILLLPGLINP